MLAKILSIFLLSASSKITNFSSNFYMATFCRQALALATLCRQALALAIFCRQALALATFCRQALALATNAVSKNSCEQPFWNFLFGWKSLLFQLRSRFPSTVRRKTLTPLTNLRKQFSCKLYKFWVFSGIFCPKVCPKASIFFDFFSVHHEEANNEGSERGKKQCWIGSVSKNSTSGGVPSRKFKKQNTSGALKRESF